MYTIRKVADFWVKFTFDASKKNQNGQRIMSIKLWMFYLSCCVIYLYNWIKVEIQVLIFSKASFWSYSPLEQILYKFVTISTCIKNILVVPIFIGRYIVTEEYILSLFIWMYAGFFICGMDIGALYFGTTLVIYCCCATCHDTLF